MSTLSTITDGASSLTDTAASYLRTYWPYALGATAVGVAGYALYRPQQSSGSQQSTQRSDLTTQGRLDTATQQGYQAGAQQASEAYSDRMEAVRSEYEQSLSSLRERLQSASGDPSSGSGGGQSGSSGGGGQPGSSDDGDQSGGSDGNGGSLSEDRYTSLYNATTGADTFDSTDLTLTGTKHEDVTEEEIVDTAAAVAENNPDATDREISEAATSTALFGGGTSPSAGGQIRPEDRVDTSDSSDTSQDDASTDGNDSSPPREESDDADTSGGASNSTQTSPSAGGQIRPEDRVDTQDDQNTSDDTSDDEPQTSPLGSSPAAGHAPPPGFYD